MRIFTRRLALLSMLLVACAPGLRAQRLTPFQYYQGPRLTFNGAGSSSGVKAFTYSSDNTYTGANPWGRALDSIWYNVPVVKAYDELGVNPLTNGTGGIPSLVGKFALILRGGNISFSQKAAYCKRAGAIGCIIVNHKNGGLINMAPTAPFDAEAASIPIVFISREDGFPINDAIKAGQAVTVSLGTWGFKFNNDLGFVDRSPAVPHAFCIPASQIGTGTSTPKAYDFYNGAYVANFGTDTQRNVVMRQTLSFTPTGGSASTIYTDSVTQAVFAPKDSIRQFLSSNVTHQTFSGTGILNMAYSLSSNNADQNTIDNSANYQLYITDSIFCKSRWNPDRNGPLVSGSIFYPTAAPLVWGPLFYVTNGGYEPKKAQLAIVTDSDLFSANTTGLPSVLVYLYKWKDQNSDGLVNGNELTIVSVGARSSFAANDSSGKPVMVDLANAKIGSKIISRLENNSWYFLAAELEHTFRLGTDNINFVTRNRLSKEVDVSAGAFGEYWAPGLSANLTAPYTITQDTLESLVLGEKGITSVTDTANVSFRNFTGRVPAMALHISRQIPTSVESNKASAFSQFDVYPNPAIASVNAKVELLQQSTIIVSIVNTLGQSMMFKTTPAFKSGSISVNTAAYPAGNYYFVIGTDDGTEIRPFTVAH